MVDVEARLEGLRTPRPAIYNIYTAWAVYMVVINLFGPLTRGPNGERFVLGITDCLTGLGEAVACLPRSP